MKKLLLVFLIFGYYQAISQIEVGVELQVYPTGFIPGIHLEYELSPHSGLQGRIGYNVVRHRDLGVHQDERGGGFGGTLGYRYYFKPERKGMIIGLRCDLWQNEVDWRDGIGLITEMSGTSNVTVLQPTGELGYTFALNNNLTLVPTISLGAEINIKTEGEEIGQGAILLLGATLSKRF